MHIQSAPRPLSYIQREANAKANQEARVEAWNDPTAAAIRRVRRAMIALSSIEAEAGRIFARENDPVPLPDEVKGLLVHPQRAAALAAFIADQGWSSDPKAPIAPTRSHAEILDALAVEARAEIDAAEAAMLEVEADRRAAFLAANA